MELYSRMLLSKIIYKTANIAALMISLPRNVLSYIGGDRSSSYNSIIGCNPHVGNDFPSWVTTKRTEKGDLEYSLITWIKDNKLFMKCLNSKRVVIEDFRDGNFIVDLIDSSSKTISSLCEKLTEFGVRYSGVNYYYQYTLYSNEASVRILDFSQFYPWLPGRGATYSGVDQYVKCMNGTTPIGNVQFPYDILDNSVIPVSTICFILGAATTATVALFFNYCLRGSKRKPDVQRLEAVESDCKRFEELNDKLFERNSKLLYKNSELTNKWEDLNGKLSIFWRIYPDLQKVFDMNNIAKLWRMFTSNVESDNTTSSSSDEGSQEYEHVYCGVGNPSYRYENISDIDTDIIGNNTNH